jgi:hypothetical protein
VTLTCHVRGDASTEEWATQRNADLFRQAFKRDLIIQAQPIRPVKTAARSIEPMTLSEGEPLLARVREIKQLLEGMT